MREKLDKLKSIVAFLLMVGFVFGITGAAYAGTNNIQARPTSDADIYELVVNDKVVMRFRTVSDSLTAFDRSKIILQRLQSIEGKGQLNCDSLKIKVVNGLPTITIGGKVIVTATQIDLNANKSTHWGLIEAWHKNFKEALEKSKNNPKLPAPAPSEPKQPETPSKPKEQQESSVLSADELRMLNLINQERAKAGLAPLKIHKELVRLARLKSQDMITNKYFSHQSPVYGSPFDMMKSAGISYKRAGENIAGASTVDRAHTNLMNSPGHRANILNPDFTHIGIGIVDGGPYGKMFTQMFIRP